MLCRSGEFGRFCLAAILALAPAAAVAGPTQEIGTAADQAQAMDDGEPEEFFRNIERMRAAEGEIPLYPELEVELYKAFKDLYVRGERPADWTAGGIDLQATLTAGGAEKMMVTRDKSGPTALLSSDEALAHVISADWKEIGRYGEKPDADQDVSVEITYISPKVVAASVARLERRGSAHCASGGETTLYLDPAVPATKLDVITFVTTHHMIDELQQRKICFVIKQSEAGTYVQKYFDAEGHRLPTFDAVSTPYTLEPLAPLSELRAEALERD